MVSDLALLYFILKTLKSSTLKEVIRITILRHYLTPAASSLI
jgi:hypothetical protein